MAIPIPEKNISHPDISGVTGNILHIEYIEVEPQYRRKGVGRVLASIAAREAERVGVKHILLSPMDIGGG
jgi:ribosomal protein S18 acetylase RimI-like enzyme